MHSLIYSLSLTFFTLFVFCMCLWRVCLLVAGSDTAAELAPLGRERGVRPLNSCVELDVCSSVGLDKVLMEDGPRVAALLSFEGEEGTETELVARVTPMLRASDF